MNAGLLLRSTFVQSLGRATLFDANGERIYDQQVILGHLVIDETMGSTRFQSRIVTEIGFANSGTGRMQGDPEHCYSALITAHANAFNLHQSKATPSKCIPELPEPAEIPEENCPVLLDLERDGFHLSGADPAVSFDIDGDGYRNEIAWTRAEEDEAFLCWDRNRNGSIDDGRELFGYATLLRTGLPAGNGYVALAELDQVGAGGNADGRVSTDDALYQALCAWVDRNRDGVSQNEEIQSLADVGVVALEYGYRESRIVDGYGNHFRYFSRSLVRTSAGTLRVWPTADVIFAEAEP